MPNTIPSVSPASSMITEANGPPIVGQNYSLFCQVSGINVFSYRWLKDGRLLNETESILSFAPLYLHHAGRYTCKINTNINENREVTIASKLQSLKYFLVSCRNLRHTYYIYHVMCTSISSSSSFCSTDS